MKAPRKKQTSSQCNLQCSLRKARFGLTQLKQLRGYELRVFNNLITMRSEALRPIFLRKNAKLWGNYCLEQNKMLSTIELN